MLLPLLRIMRQTILDFERAAMNAKRDAVSRQDKGGFWFCSLGATDGSPLNAASPEFTSG
jgi:hypothetical protein